MIIGRNIQPVQQLFYEIGHGNITISTVLGLNTITVRPPLKEVWLLDRVNLSQTDTANRTFSIGYVLLDPTVLMSLHTEGTIVIAKGGPAVEQTVFPIWHDPAGLDQDHFSSVGPPLQMDNNHYLQLKGFNFAAGKQITAKWQYRRVI